MANYIKCHAGVSLQSKQLSKFKFYSRVINNSSRKCPKFSLLGETVLRIQKKEFGAVKTCVMYWESYFQTSKSYTKI